MALYGVYIKSHCAFPDYETKFEAKNKKEAVENLYNALHGEIPKDYLEEHIYLIKGNKRNSIDKRKDEWKYDLVFILKNYIKNEEELDLVIREIERSTQKWLKI